MLELEGFYRRNGDLLAHADYTLPRFAAFARFFLATIMSYLYETSRNHRYIFNINVPNMACHSIDFGRSWLHLKD